MAAPARPNKWSATASPNGPSTPSSDSGRSLRRSPQKPQTPGRATRSSAAANDPSSDLASQSKPQTPVRPASQPPKKRKPVFVSCVNFPQGGPVPAPVVKTEQELQRSQRKSKQDAISKLDRAGTPSTTPVPTGPAATSFVPPPQAPAGPGVQRNPLKRPRVVNPPFDINSVRTSVPASSSEEPRLFDLPTCPSYHPTAAEFTNPMAYIESIAPEAKKYGICKIIPPEGWQMPFMLETDHFRFTTRLQRLNSIEAASRAKINFLEQLSMFHKQQGDATAYIPRIEHRLLDLWSLRKEVNKVGGVDEVNRLKAWAKITVDLGYQATATPQVKAAYLKIVLPFENWALRAKSFPESPPGSAPGSAIKTARSTTHNSPSTPTANGRMTGMRTSPRSRGAHLAAMTAGPEAGPSSAGRNGALAAPAKIKLKVPGFHTSSHGSDSELSEEESSRASTSATPDDPLKYEKGDVCEICGVGNHAPKILLCDGCDRGFHTYCLDPPLASVPENEWYCTACLLGNGDDYGFDEGEEHSLPSFQVRDAAFTEEWFTRYAPSRSAAGPLTRQIGTSSVSEADVEREFWRLVESQDDTVEVEYGADVHSTTHGSAAPTLETFPNHPYSNDQWNLNNMPIVQDSLLRYIKSDISGMTVPWIYVGMLFSAFCWHNEDHYTYSVNYMFWGETKTWYGIPGGSADKFEEAIKREAPELFERQPALLYQLVTMMNPGRLRDQGVDVYACDQRPNEFVITFPKAYHCGFNHGLNFNEAVNFALPDWLKDGHDSVRRYAEHAKPPVFSHEELLITITLYTDTIKTALWLQDNLRRMLDEESSGRRKLREQLPGISEVLHEEDVPEAQYQCCVCKGFCYLSQVTCTCTDAVSCLDHFDLLCGCAPSSKTLRMRHSEDQLRDIVEVIEARAAQPEAWRLRLDSLLETARPQLKSIKQLVADGERIPYPLEGLGELRTFFQRASAWVDRATAIFTRKSTARRRKGRQSVPAPVEDDDIDRSPAALRSLIAEAETLAFDTAEIGQLRQVVGQMGQFEQDATDILSKSDDNLNYETCRTALILGESLNLDLPIVSQLRTVVNRLRWFRKIDEEVDDRTVQYSDILHFLDEAKEFGVSDSHPHVIELQRLAQLGREWKQAVDTLLASKSISIDKVSELIEGHEYTPTSVETMRQLENIRKTATGWQVSAAGLLESHGSAASAQRLVKTVNTANGALRRVHIPEVEQLADQLEHIDEWLRSIAETLNVSEKNVHHSLKTLVSEIEDHLAEDDDTPNDEHACFCRSAPTTNMVTCPICEGAYHPKCVGISAKSASGIKTASETFRCQMCVNLQYHDRPSFHKLALHVDPLKYTFALHPPEWDIIKNALEHTLRYAGMVIKLISWPNALSRKEGPEISHLLRKIWTLPIQLDAWNHDTNDEVVFEHWLYHRLREVTDTAGLPKTAANGRTRARKPRFDFENTAAHEFHCICTTEPLDHLLTVQCGRCEQSFHLSCVKAPLNQVQNPSRGGWKCPFCVVKQGKPAVRGLDLRVQMKDKIGTNQYIDWRQSIFVYSEAPITCTLPPNPDAVTLIATQYHGPALPDNFERPTWVPDNGEGRKRRKTDPGAGAGAGAGAPAASLHLRLIPPLAPASTPVQSGPQPPGYAPLIHPSATNGQPASPVVPPNQPAQNQRNGGGVFYATHKQVPWNDANMFSSFQLPINLAGPKGDIANGHPSPMSPRPPQPAPGPSMSSMPVTIPPPPPSVLATAPSAYVNVVPAKRDLPNPSGAPSERSPKRVALASPRAAQSRPE
ncbi:hypothetical protein CspHIS471_0404910 [Cutaneotrichosporon sp. HIS471]|nr:hypothetical protein CspHIS471_0404910 [Cutaneotrichosporon sp. HIS471]